MTPEVLDQLRAERWSDPDGRLGADGAALGEALDALAGRGRSAYVVVAPAGTSVGELRGAWDELRLDDRQDLVLLYDGRRWEARGWGLDDAEIGQILDQREEILGDDVGDGLVAALDALEGAAAPALVGPVAIGAGSVVGVAALGALGWLIARRTRIRREEAETARARTSLEDAVAHLILGAEVLGEPGRELQERAARLQQELRRLPADEDVRVRVARIHQLEDEVTALQSQLLAARPEGVDPGRVHHEDTADRARAARNPQTEG